MLFKIYSDGSTRGNGKENAVGAWAYVVLNDKEEMIHKDCQTEVNTTNQRMELTAAAEALEYLTYNELVVPFDRIELYTDSAYLCNCYMQKWYINWRASGWVNSKKQPVANRDLWERLIKFFDMPEVEIKKLKGHAGNKWNEVVDTMAQTASIKRRVEENGSRNN